MRGRRPDLPGEACVPVPVPGLSKPRGELIAAQESAEGIVGHDVGKAIEALQAALRQAQEAEQRIGRAGNGG